MIVASDAPHTRPNLWRELAAGLAVFGVYLVVDFLGGPARHAAADRNAEYLIDIERWLHIDNERSLNEWLTPHELLTTLANYEYAVTYIASAFLLLAWLYWRHPADYRRARSSFIVLNLLAIACFVLYPVTPPRLLPELGYVDTVLQGGTVGSWGTPLVSNANQLAAMPSLHIAWALWVSVVLARLAQGLFVQSVSAVHVAVTVFVIVATANHYWVDAIAAIPFIWASVAVVDWHRTRVTPATVPAADAFFLHVETDNAPQHVGGMVVLDTSGPGVPSLDEVRALIRDELGNLPRFRQRILAATRWRRARWVDADPIDWKWHVCERLAPVAPGGPVDGVDGVDAAAAALGRAVADLAAQRLPLDRPPWRMVLVREITPGRTGLAFLVHHSVADGIGTVVQALQLLRPRIALPDADPPPPSRVRKAAAIGAGLAQLATDGSPAKRLTQASGGREFATTRLAMPTVRAVAHAHHARVTDLVLGLVGTAIVRIHPEFAAAAGGRLRVSVPIMLREPGSAAEGNVTAAVLIDIPLGEMSTAARIAEIRTRSDRLRTPTRALASRFVMSTVLGVCPVPAQRWFARTVYGPAIFQSIVSNMPGPDTDLSFCDVPLEYVVPILPLAPGVPLALGALSWHGQLGLGLAGDPAVLRARPLLDEIAHVLDELATDAALAPQETSQSSSEVPHSSASSIWARARGESSAPPK
ncbi:phosphatase PAP2 family protein [Aldersonia sp. NBC_00410]|uniref:bifunctional phosphatase PAP2/O-acyltransferase family protein n=1 Tax=Aldersonia sp. NBC_00410 TaxID=2975954 RepID=UPI002253991B|nr:phosphatase PAP2 family protein [Aldersonia sp. NBC_00410]MCX5043742.1 phosphatase PAP2 family protein [Aldersonia sp. NBC_00410]